MPDAQDARLAFAEATAWFLAVVSGIEAEQWDGPGLGEWSVRELTAHTGRALTTTVAYLDAADAATSVDLADPGAYYRAALAIPEIHTAVAQRGRQAAGDLGEDPMAAASAWAEPALDRVQRASPTALVATIVGGMRLDDYLVTRVVELVLHTLDLARATGQAANPPTGAGRLVLDTLIATAPDAAIGPALLALSGRDGQSGLDLLGFGPRAEPASAAS